MAGRRGSTLEGWLSTPGRGSPQRARHRRRAARGAGAALVSLGWLGTRSSRTRQHCACRPRSGSLQNGDSGASPPALPTGRGLRLQAPPWPGVRAESCNHPANEPRRSDRHEEARTSLDPPLRSPKFNRVRLLCGAIWGGFRSHGELRAPQIVRCPSLGGADHMPDHIRIP